MELTPEQYDIINSTGSINKNAVAGSGKTTTLIEYAKARPKDKKILYLAFTKSANLEAVKKFAEKGLKKVKVETAHSLAYKHIVFQKNYIVTSLGNLTVATWNFGIRVNQFTSFTSPNISAIRKPKMQATLLPLARRSPRPGMMWLW